MLSGNKRTAREHNESMPPNKRHKTNKNVNEWPKKHKLNKNELSKLPSIMNPSLHKAVFQSFWNKKKFGSPTIEFTETTSTINPKQKMFKCIMTLINKQNKSQKIMVTSSNFDSKKKGEINIYQQFNYNYIPFKILLLKMKPYSFTTNANAQQSITQK
eukprot:418119_1